MRYVFGLCGILLLVHAAGCAPGVAVERAPQIRLATPEAAFRTAQRLLVGGHYELYCDRLLSRRSSAAARDRLMALRQRLRRRPTASEFDPEFAELASRGLDAAAIQRMTARQFAVALLKIRYRPPPGAAARPDPQIAGIVAEEDLAIVYYRVGPQSPIRARMDLVREQREWKVEEFSPPPPPKPAGQVPPLRIPDDPDPPFRTSLPSHWEPLSG